MGLMTLKPIHTTTTQTMTLTRGIEVDNTREEGGQPRTTALFPDWMQRHPTGVMKARMEATLPPQRTGQLVNNYHSHNVATMLHTLAWGTRP